MLVSPSHPTWQLVTGQLMTQLGVRSSDGYTIQPSHASVQISGYTGGAYDMLTITAPTSLMGTDVSLFIQGNAGAGQTASLYWYEPSSSSKQSVVVVELTAGGTPDSGYVHITGEFYDLTVKKVDGYTGEALDGAMFQLPKMAEPLDSRKRATVVMPLAAIPRSSLPPGEPLLSPACQVEAISLWR